MDQSSQQPPVSIRVAELADIPFIFNSWLKSYRDAPAVKNVPNTIYFSEHHKVIEHILNAKGLMILVACNPDDRDQICGYIVGELSENDSIVHWLYCKHPFRKMGIGRALEAAFLDLAPAKQALTYTHMSKISDRIQRLKSYTFNPYKQRSNV